MRIGYAWISLLEQVSDFETQERELRAARAERIYLEQVSSVAARPELRRLLSDLRKGDILVTTHLNRLVRSVSHLGELIQHLDKVGADFDLLDMGINTTTPTGRKMFNILKSITQFERKMMLERQRESTTRKTGNKFTADPALD